ncbi:MAG: RNA methyltransferase [Chitinophagales bacterium]|nr:RNA methyltransferase [Chitinophagaceae bacterium]MCB9064476.1 RNA methyltransferase [Chitinophagales bacterium]
MFIAEGDKIAKEWLMSDWNIKMIVATADWVEQNHQLVTKHNAELFTVPDHELKNVSTLQTPNKVLLVVSMAKQTSEVGAGDWSIALEHIQDPGNMGTIIRIADWFGIKHIIASEDCVEFFNPKVVQAAMGGHIRVSLHEAKLKELISKTEQPVYAAALDGDDIYSLTDVKPGIILIGNESKGLSQDLLDTASQKVTIPRKGGAESLNAAVATGILAALLTGR